MCRYSSYGGDMSPYTPSGYGFTPTPHTNQGNVPGGGSGGGAGGGNGGGSSMSSGGYDISGTTDYVDSTTFDPRQTPIEPLPDSNLVSPVVSTGKFKFPIILVLDFFFFYLWLLSRFAGGERERERETQSSRSIFDGPEPERREKV